MLRRVAFLVMDVRIGTTLDGQTTGFDTITSRPLMLLGDPGCGKTTIARYLTRWWLADTLRHAHVYAQAPSEWADLRCIPEHPDRVGLPITCAHPRGTCLVVVDGVRMTENELLAVLQLGASRTVVAAHSSSGLDSPVLDADFACVGLIRPDRADPAAVAVLDGQGRLDWPTGTVAVITDQRGSADFPCHRWQASADHRLAVAP